MSSAWDLPPPGLTDVVAIAAGDYHSLALKSDGSLVAWGNDGCGQCWGMNGLSGVVAIAAGAQHSLALMSDGMVIARGADYWGETMVPAGLTGVIAIAAGDARSAALRGDGTVVRWGYSPSVPDGLNGVVAISHGSEYWAVLVREKSVASFHGTAGTSLHTLLPRLIPSATYTAAGLPPGLSLHPLTALVSGTPMAGGIYHGTLTATLGAETRTMPLTANIAPVPGSGPAAYAAWRAAELPGKAPGAPEEDADGDGSRNLLEFAFGTPPGDPSQISETALAGRPAMFRNADGFLTLTVDVPATAPSQLLFSAEFAGTPDFPAPQNPVPPILISGAPPDRVRLSFTDPAGAGAPRRFGRLAVTLP